MTEYAGTYSTDLPIVSLNQAAIIKHKAKFYTGTSSISLPLVKGTRYIILSLVTEGKSVNIGFGKVAGTITDSRLSYIPAAGPIDLSNFFSASPFTQYKEPNDDFLYLIVNAETNKVITIAVAALKA